MATKITFRNDFHGTECTVSLPESCRLSPRQAKRLHDELCGANECQCGEHGIRGPQRGPNDELMLWQTDPDGYICVSLLTDEDTYVS